MPKDNIYPFSITNWISSENFTKAHSNNQYYIGYTDKQQKKREEEKKQLLTYKETSSQLYKALKTQRSYSPQKTMRFCGLNLVENGLSAGSGLTCHVNKHGVTVSGVAFCQSPFCVTCMGYRRTERMKKIEKGLIQAQKQGYNAWFVTLTIERTNLIKKQVKDLMQGWKYLQDKLSYRLKKQGISLFMVRNLDITFKPESNQIYHTHLHCIVITDKKLQPFKDRKTKINIDNLPMFLEHAWVDIQTRKGNKCVLQGQYIERIREDKGLSRYVSKFEGMKQELCNFAHKKGKETKLCKGSIGFMELLGYCYKGHEKCISVYREFIKAMKGTRTVSFSRKWMETDDDTGVILSVLDKPYPEDPEDDSDEDTETEKLHVPLHWYLKIGVKHLDIFFLCVHHAFLSNRLHILKKLLLEEPDQNELFSVFDVFDMHEYI